MLSSSCGDIGSMSFTLMSFFYRLCLTRAPGAVLLIRLMIGGVFLSEGVQKFLFPMALGVGRFGRVGIPASDVLAPLVGGFEVFCGLLVLLGFFTRLAILPLLLIMLVAFFTTKLPILLQDGFWKMAHEARTDYCMVLGLLFLLLAGAGKTSMDAWLTGRRRKKAAAHRH